MQTLKRLAVWSAETTTEVPFLIGLLMLESDFRQLNWFDLRIAFIMVAVFMVGSGYLITTAIVGILFRSESPWLYPTIAALLFVAHVQVVVRWWKLGQGSSPVPFEVAGACIVFGCTFCGGWFLRRWTQLRFQHPATVEAHTLPK